MFLNETNTITQFFASALLNFFTHIFSLNSVTTDAKRSAERAFRGQAAHLSL